MNRFLNLIRLFVLIFSVLYINKQKVYCQDLSTIIKQDPLIFNGNLSVDQMISPKLNSDPNFSRKFYSYFITGGISSSFYGISIPVTFSFTNENLNFNHPFNFNQFGAQPSYKWIKIFIGYNSFNYSPYTLNGHQFCGFGFEITPPDFPVSVSASFGRLLKPVDFDSSQSIPSFRRLGVGFKSSLNLKRIKISTSTFYAWDDEKSIISPPDSIALTPKENITFSLEGNIEPYTGIRLDLNLGNSVLTDDKFSAISNEYQFWGGIFPGRASTKSYWAYKTGLNYSIKNGTLGIGYERIQPNFQTLGAYYITNDLQNITINSSKRFYEGKININANLGIQRDNLDQQKLFSNKRLVGAASLVLMIGKKLNVNANFSSFNSYTNIRSVFDIVNSSSPYQHIDTLNYSQVNKTGILCTAYTFEKDGVNHSISLSTSGNQSDNKLTKENINNKSIFINSGLTYSLNISNMGLNLSFSTLYNLNKSSILNSSTIGPFLSFSKSLKYPKVRFGFNVAYNQSINSLIQNINYNARLYGNWESKMGHSINLSTGFFRSINRKTELFEKKELTINCTYSYKFSYKIKSQKEVKKTNPVNE